MNQKIIGLVAIVTLSISISGLASRAAEQSVHAKEHPIYVSVKSGGYKDFVIHTPTKKWLQRGSHRHGELGWWSEIHKTKAEEHMLLEHPFEIRWRFVLKDDPVRIIDDGIVDDEASFPDTLRQ